MEIIVSSKKCRIDEADALKFVGVSLFVGSNGYLRTHKHHYGAERYVHRIIMNAGPGEQVDHRNGNKLDNRRCNLRICSQFENMANARLRKDSASRVTGVSWDARRLQWRAQISVKGKMHVLGRFDKFGDAVAARREAEKKYHGAFAASLGAQANV